MRTPILAQHARPSALGLLAGGIVSAFAVIVGAPAIAQRTDASARAILEATHLPPLLVLSGERVKLAFDVYCARDDEEDPEASCEPAGTLFLRAGTTGAYRAAALEPAVNDGVRQLTAVVPDDVAADRDGFEYYAEIEADDVGDAIVVPPGGPSAPYRSRVLSDVVDVHLAAESFGAARSGARVVRAPWGDGASDVGLEPGRTTDPIGASSFDVDIDGTILLLDEAHRRALRWVPGGRGPARVPLSVTGQLADLTIADDGSIYVLETVAPPGRTPLVRRFDETGRELDVVQTAEATPSQIRSGPDGPVVLEHPSHLWMPVASDGVPVSPDEQRRGGRVSQPLRSGMEVTAFRTGNELRLAILADGRLQRAWRLTSATALGEVQLAEPLGSRLVAVLRVYTDTSDEFRVLVLDRHGLARQFAVASSDWAETAPLSRFRLRGGDLYQLGSDPSGAFVDRYDLEVRR
jgi:hypothetical protein